HDLPLPDCDRRHAFERLCLSRLARVLVQCPPGARTSTILSINCNGETSVIKSLVKVKADFLILAALRQSCAILWARAFGGTFRCQHLYDIKSLLSKIDSKSASWTAKVICFEHRAPLAQGEVSGCFTSLSKTPGVGAQGLSWPRPY